MLCKTFAINETNDYKFVVVFSRYQGKLMLSRHRERTTWETQGGHIEPGETPLQAARRELWEESGALTFTLAPVCGYRATKGEWKDGANGTVFLAEVTELGPLPPSEMAETQLFHTLPQRPALTYPDITPCLWACLEGSGLWASCE